MGEYCPITGEPLQPGQTVSRGAVRKFHTYIKTLPSLMADVDYAIAAARGDGGGAQACMPKAPINLALLDEAAEMTDAINTWAVEWLTHLSGEAPRIFIAGDWTFIARILSCQEGKLSRWEDAPACIDEIIYVLDRLEYLISKPSPTEKIMIRCGACLLFYSVPAVKLSSRCPSCGTRVDTEEGRDRCLEALYDVPVSLGEAVLACRLYGVFLKIETVRSWVKRGQVTSTAETSTGKALFTPRSVVEASLERGH